MAKFWQGEEDTEAGAVVWEIAAKPATTYGSEVWACAIRDNHMRPEQVQERTEQAILGVSWRFPGVVIRGDLKFTRHHKALSYIGRLRAIWRNKDGRR